MGHSSQQSAGHRRREHSPGLNHDRPRPPIVLLRYRWPWHTPLTPKRRGSALSRFRRCLPLALLAVALTIWSAAEALAEKRVALVIGNSAYRNVGRLANPAQDAAAIETLLKRAGFEVVARRDLAGTEMKRVIRNFADLAQDSDIALVFYAGHGIEVDGTNYLLPVDTVLERDSDVEDEAVSLDRLLRVIDPAKRLRLVILDACRDNPFAKTMKRTVGTRAVHRGLAKVEPTQSDTLIAYAAKAGTTASDGDGVNSPFTTALVNNLLTPGLDLRIALGRVRDEVLKATKRRQEPFVYGSLGGDVVSLVAAAAAPATAAPSGTRVAVAVPPAPAAPADIGRSLATFEQYQGYTFEIGFQEVQTNVQPAKGFWRVQKSVEVFVRSPAALVTALTVGANSKTATRQATAPLEMSEHGISWLFKDQQLVGAVRGAGFFMRTSIALNGQACQATVSYDRLPGKAEFEVARGSDNKIVSVSALAAEKIACRMTKGDVVTQKR
jgi:hypothetical protein